MENRTRNAPYVCCHFHSAQKGGPQVQESQVGKLWDMSDFQC